MSERARPVFLSAQQVSERWGGIVKTSTLDTWRSRGKGPRFTKIGGRALYRLDDLEAFEEAQRRQSTRG